MTVTPGRIAADHWPDPAQTQLTLDDGTIIVSRTRIGIIDFYRNIGALGADGNLVSFTRNLAASATDSLKDLARRCRQAPAAYSMEAFSGMSHLARLARRFGFTVFDISGKGRRREATRVSFNIATEIAEGNRDWENLKQNYKPAQIAMISSANLLQRFGH